MVVTGAETGNSDCGTIGEWHGATAVARGLHSKSGSLSGAGCPQANGQGKKMANQAELPELVEQFVEMSKEYLLQETVEPAKKLGRYAGYAVGAAAAFALGALFLAIAGARLIIRLLPDGPYWEGLGYVLAAIALGIVAGVIINVTQRTTPDMKPSDDSAAAAEAAADGTVVPISAPSGGTTLDAGEDSAAGPAVDSSGALDGDSSTSPDDDSDSKESA